jgi:phosphoribosylamine--glycine ligase/phosphoribosylglycinamide formyltransferase/phosphoribosylformylglycinamidine cyclo-ligase
VDRKSYPDRRAHEAEMLRQLDLARPDLVCLAGYMRLLSPEFVGRWRGRILNIHPALLPKFPGLDVQRRALEAGEKESGCTVHFVDEGTDTGPIVLQRRVPILPGTRRSRFRPGSSSRSTRPIRRRSRGCSRVCLGPAEP